VDRLFFYFGVDILFHWTFYIFKYVHKFLLIIFLYKNLVLTMGIVFISTSRLEFVSVEYPSDNFYGYTFSNYLTCPVYPVSCVRTSFMKHKLYEYDAIFIYGERYKVDGLTKGRCKH